MNDWAAGYRAALADVLRLAHSRSLLVSGVAALIVDLEADAFVIEHEQGSRLQRRRLAAAREALPLPLFGDKS